MEWPSENRFSDGLLYKHQFKTGITPTAENGMMHTAKQPILRYPFLQCHPDYKTANHGCTNPADTAYFDIDPADRLLLTPATSLSKSNSATVYIFLIRTVGSGILSDSVLPFDPPVKLHPILGTDGNFIFLAAYKTASQLTGGNSGSIKSGK